MYAPLVLATFTVLVTSELVDADVAGLSAYGHSMVRCPSSELVSALHTDSTGMAYVSAVRVAACEPVRCAKRVYGHACAGCFESLVLSSAALAVAPVCW